MTSLAGIRPPPLSAPVSSLNTPREIDGVRRAKVIGKHVKPVVGGRVLLTQKESEEVDHEFRACAMRVYVSLAFLATDSSAHALLSSLTLPHSSVSRSTFTTRTYIFDEAGGGLPCTPLSQGDIRGETWHNLYCLRRLLLGQLGQRGRVLV